MNGGDETAGGVSPGGRGAVMNEPIAKKAYYSIGEVCDLTGLKPHVLRYWETQFDVLSPTKNRAGNRVFRPKEIELILLVKHLLYEEKYTIEGARRRLQEMRRAGELEEERQDVLEPEVLNGMKAELQALLDVLSPDKPLAES
jgi:DNA-binding transcriptional MerR regulator